MGAAGPHLVLVRDGRQRRARHRARPRPRAAARDRHDPLRDHALGEPGAHADGARAPGREAEALPRLREMGARLRGDRPGHRHRPPGAAHGTAQIVADLPVGRRSAASRRVYERPVRAPTPSRAPTRRQRPCRRATRREALLRLLASPGPRQQALDLGAVRPHGAGPTRCSGRAATPPWCASHGTEQGAGARPPTARRATAAPTRSAAARRRWPRPGAT